ncbi:MAG: T9SS type A sorting domain-containing protein [Flavobacteriales bacterium]|nr:T9SS type A sorting domain-containing protein [Flavobacteriales bacterium]
MNKYALFFPLLALTGPVAKGQSTFQKYYYGGGTAKANLNELSSGNLFVGMAYQSGTSTFDPMGNILNTQCYAIDTFLILQSVKMITDNEFSFVGGYRKDTCSTDPPYPENYPVVGKMDSVGTILTASYYDLNGPECTNTAADLEILNDGSAVVWGRKYISPSTFIMKVGNEGGSVWAKHFSNAGSFQFVKELPGGDLLVGLNMAHGGAALARLDANGNFIWLKSYIRPAGVVRDCRIESDSSFTVIGYTNEDNDPGNKLFMMRLNGTGNVQWCKGYDHSGGWASEVAKIVETLDGSYVVLGGFGKAFLMKTDMNGDTLWTRASGVGGTYYQVYNLLAHSDGGFLYNGQGFGLGTFLFKADSLGHLPCPEHEHVAYVQVQELFPTDSSFTLTSIDGAVQYPAYIHDTIYDPVTVIDGCTITQIPSYSTKKPIRIRPNPTTGQFTVSFEDPLLADTFYSVYDSMGKLLYQRPLPSGATTAEVDLAWFGKGMYLLKITDPGGVSTERVVVE